MCSGGPCWDPGRFRWNHRGHAASPQSARAPSSDQGRNERRRSDSAEPPSRACGPQRPEPGPPAQGRQQHEPAGNRSPMPARTWSGRPNRGPRDDQHERVTLRRASPRVATALLGRATARRNPNPNVPSAGPHSTHSTPVPKINQKSSRVHRAPRMTRAPTCSRPHPRTARMMPRGATSSRQRRSRFGLTATGAA